VGNNIITGDDGDGDHHPEVTGVVYTDTTTNTTTTLPSSLIITNIDLPYTKKYLLPPSLTTTTYHDHYTMSSSVISLCFSMNKTFPSLRHHTVFLQEKEARKAWDNLMKRNVFDKKCFNFYVHSPSRTDRSACPPGGDAIMVLVRSGRRRRRRNPCAAATAVTAAAAADDDDEEEEDDDSQESSSNNNSPL